MESGTNSMISPEDLESIRQDVNDNQPELSLAAVTDEHARHQLAGYVRRRFKTLINGKQENTEYIVKELVGLGFLEDILSAPGVTDIGWNGTDLTVETNDAKVMMTPEDLGGVDEQYIIKIIQRLAQIQNKEFNDNAPIMDLLKDGLRVNAISKSLSPDGTTMSIRVTKPQLALNQDNFTIFAPMFILDMIHTIILTHANISISGITGTGKTELQKLMLSFTNPTDRIIMIEDVQETHLKELFPDKDIFSWLTSPTISISDLVKASLRNNPDWIIVSETRGPEAYEMLQAILTGNNIVTTLHAISSSAVPKRFANMIAQKYSNTNEASLMEDILSYFDFDFHIEKMMIHNEKTGEEKRIRFLAEVREFADDENKGHWIFKQEFRHGKFYISTQDFSPDFKKRMAMRFLDFDMPQYKDEERTEIENTPEGKLLAEIRKNNGADKKLTGSTVYNNYDKNAKAAYEDDDNAFNDVEEAYVDPRKKKDYSNPHHISPKDKSLYQAGYDQRDKYKPADKALKPAPKKKSNHSILNRTTLEDNPQANAKFGRRIIKK